MSFAPRDVRIVPYDPGWPAAFGVEAFRLRNGLGNVALRNHCGVAREYEDLKRAAAARIVTADPASWERYAAAKTEFIERVVGLAITGGYPRDLSDR
jgi:GrpB-like predicted nucleotidyltransferase (UPF0157 family)